MLSEVISKLSPKSASPILHILGRRHIEVSGPDTYKFLQGLTTNNVTQFANKEASILYSAFLNPKVRLSLLFFVLFLQGRIVADTMLHNISTSNDGNKVVIECDEKNCDALFKMLRVYKLRSKVQVSLAEQYQVSSITLFEYSSNLLFSVCICQFG